MPTKEEMSFRAIPSADWSKVFHRSLLGNKRAWIERSSLSRESRFKRINHRTSKAFPMPNRVFIIHPKSPKQPVTSESNDQQRPDETVNTVRMRINAPPLNVDPANDWDDEEFHFRYRPISLGRRQPKQYQQTLTRVSEDESPYPAFSAIVSAPLVKLPHETRASASGESGLSTKRKESGDSTNIQGQTLLHLAAILGHEEIMRILIGEISQDVPLINTRGQTPLLSAIEAGSTSTAIFLMIQNPLSLTCQDTNGSSVFHYATENCNHIVLNRALSLLKQLNSCAARLTVSEEYHFSRCTMC